MRSCACRGVVDVGAAQHELEQKHVMPSSGRQPPPHARAGPTPPAPSALCALCALCALSGRGVHAVPAPHQVRLRRVRAWPHCHAAARGQGAAGEAPRMRGSIEGEGGEGEGVAAADDRPMQPGSHASSMHAVYHPPLTYMLSCQRVYTVVSPRPGGEDGVPAAHACTHACMHAMPCHAALSQCAQRDALSHSHDLSVD